MQLILGSHELTCHGHPIITESTLNFPEFVPASKKSVYSICSFLRYSQIKSPMTRLDTLIFDHDHDQLLILWICTNMQKSVIPSVISSDMVSFRVLSPDWPDPFLTMPTPKIFNHLLICINLYQHAKNQLILFIHSWDTVSFRVPRPYWPHLFLTVPNQKMFIQLLIFVNFYQYAKKWGYLLDFFWKNSWFKNPSTWLVDRTLAIISGTRFFPVQDLCRNTANNIAFHYRTNLVKISLNSIFFKISLNSKDPIFGLLLAHFPNFWSKISFFRKLQLCHTQLHEGLYHHAKFREG